MWIIPQSSEKLTFLKNSLSFFKIKGLKFNNTLLNDTQLNFTQPNILQLDIILLHIANFITPINSKILKPEKIEILQDPNKRLKMQNVKYYWFSSQERNSILVQKIPPKRCLVRFYVGC